MGLLFLPRLVPDQVFSENIVVRKSLTALVTLPYFSEGIVKCYFSKHIRIFFGANACIYIGKW